MFRSEDNGTVQAMVGAGLGTALVPLLAVDTTDPAVRIIPTDLPARRIALIWHRDRYRSPAAMAFVEIAREVAATLQAELRDPRGHAPPEPDGVSSRPARTATVITLSPVPPSLRPGLENVPIRGSRAAPGR